MRNKQSNGAVSRRRFIGTTTVAASAMAFSPLAYGNSLLPNNKPDSNFSGVQIGAITYSWRSMPSTAEDILGYCKEAGISSIELMGNVAEAYAGIPPMPPRPPRGAPWPG
ncbi:MAG: twin-arginine translocation signal domain-containing protein [Tangfeifania sp.]